MRTTAGLIVLAVLSTPAWADEQAPVTIASGVVTGEADVSTRDFNGHKAWSMIWYRDAEGREVHIGFVEGIKLPYREQRMQLLKFMHDESSDEEADLRPHIQGRAEQIWGLDVYWLAASERAVMAPDHSKPETMKDGNLHRGDARRNCAVFTAYPPGPTATLVGSYCRDLAPDVVVGESTFRQWLDALDLKVVR
jgi:hypothetical protein